MKKLLLSSVMMLVVCAVSAQTEKQLSKSAARTKVLKQMKLTQNAREQEKIFAIQNAENASGSSLQLSADDMKKMNSITEESRNKAKADLRAN